MKTSARGVAAIAQREGMRLVAYRDSVGVPTIGVGHTGRMAPPVVKMGMKITQAQALAYLAADLAPVETTINKLVKVPITQNQFDAMASLAFNIGIGGLARSSVLNALNAKQYVQAAENFLKWSKPAVLIGRRKAERLQFLTPDADATSIKHLIDPDNPDPKGLF